MLCDLVFTLRNLLIKQVLYHENSRDFEFFEKSYLKRKMCAYKM